MGTHSRALDCTIIDVIDDVMWVPAINATAHRLSSPQNLLDGPCSRKTEPVSALPQEKHPENSTPHTPQLSLSLLRFPGCTTGDITKPGLVHWFPGNTPGNTTCTCHHPAQPSPEGVRGLLNPSPMLSTWCSGPRPHRTRLRSEGKGGLCAIPSTYPRAPGPVICAASAAQCSQPRQS